MTIASLLLAGSASASADPGYYVVTAYDNAGQRSVDFRYWTVKPSGASAVLWPELGFGYGVSSRWYTEVLASTIGTMDSSFKLSTWNWQNEFLLTQGEWPIDVGAHLSLIKHADADDGYSVEAGPVLQTDVGRTQLNANLFLERTYGASSAYASVVTQMKYQWQIRYRWHPALHFGAQGFGELGRWDHWDAHDRQSHRAGPAAFGTLRVSPTQSVLVQAAYLVGSTYGRSGSMFSMRAQYVF